jgi:hypothetical protein
MSCYVACAVIMGLVHFVMSWAVNNLDLTVLLCGLCCYNGTFKFKIAFPGMWTVDCSIFGLAQKSDQTEKG